VLRPAVAEESARKTLRDTLYELRRVFAPAEPLVATREAVELRCWVDLAAFPRRRRPRRLRAPRDGEHGRATLLEAAGRADALDMPGVAAHARAAADQNALVAPA
jgi:hypothetical protein